MSVLAARRNIVVLGASSGGGSRHAELRDASDAIRRLIDDLATRAGAPAADPLE